MFAARAARVRARKPAKTSLIGPCTAGPGATLAPWLQSGPHFESPLVSDLRIKPFDFQAAVARAGLRPDGMPRTEAAEAGGFRTAMADALKGVSQNQLQAETLQRELTLDNPTVSVEQTVMAMQKAQIGFQAALQVRNRLAQAYSDIMNMQV